MKRIFVLLSFACIALSGYSQEHASQYYMSYFAKYYRIDVVNYENEGFCAKIDLESSNETVTPSLYIKYANIPNFIVNLEIIKTRFVKHALQAVKDGTKNVDLVPNACSEKPEISFNFPIFSGIVFDGASFKPLID